MDSKSIFFLQENKVISARTVFCEFQFKDEAFRKFDKIIGPICLNRKFFQNLAKFSKIRLIFQTWQNWKILAKLAKFG